MGRKLSSPSTSLIAHYSAVHPCPLPPSLTYPRYLSAFSAQRPHDLLTCGASCKCEALQYIYYVACCLRAGGQAGGTSALPLSQHTVCGGGRPLPVAWALLRGGTFDLGGAVCLQWEDPGPLLHSWWLLDLPTAHPPFPLSLDSHLFPFSPASQGRTCPYSLPIVNRWLHTISHSLTGSRSTSPHLVPTRTCCLPLLPAHTL